MEPRPTGPDPHRPDTPANGPQDIDTPHRPTGPDATTADNPATTDATGPEGDPVAAQVEAMIENAVASLPPFTTEQREHLRRLLNPPYRDQ